MARLFLALSALIWLPYGLHCFAAPDFLAEAAGINAITTTGRIELRAMYGGLQAALGSLAAAGCLRSTFSGPALVTFAFVCGGLSTARSVGAWMDGELSSYTLGALALEVVTAGLAIGLLRTRRAGATP